MGPRQDDLDDEIRGHMALSIKDRIERGEDLEAARLAALKEFGNVTLTRDSMRGIWRHKWLDSAEALGRDIRFAVRSLLRAKGLAATVVHAAAAAVGRAVRRADARSLDAAAVAAAARTAVTGVDARAVAQRLPLVDVVGEPAQRARPITRRHRASRWVFGAWRRSGAPRVRLPQRDARPRDRRARSTSARPRRRPSRPRHRSGPRRAARGRGTGPTGTRTPAGDTSGTESR